MKLRIIKTKATDGVHWAVVDDHTGIVIVRNLESEAEAEAFVREQMATQSTNENAK
jgi:hypothetical protein